MTRHARSWRTALLLSLALLALVVVSIGAGRYALGPAELLAVLSGALGHASPAVSSTDAAIVWQVRLPRVMAAVLVGAALAMSGAGMQAVFRNALAAPDLLGVSAGAAFGAVIAIVLGWPVAGIQLSAFCGGLLAVTLVSLASLLLRTGDRVMTLILCGIAIGSLLSAGVAMLEYLADPVRQLPAITFWLLGSFAMVGPDDVASLAVTTLLGGAVLAALRWRVDLLLLSDDEARTSGVRVDWLRAAVIVACTVATAGAVAVAGMIGWIGLVMPHAARMAVGAGFARSLPVAALAGALMLLLVDTLARTLTDFEIPPGVLTALVGVPALFLLMALRSER